MSNTSPIHPWLDHLVDLLPPTTIRLVGAGNGSGIWVQGLAAHSQLATTLVEANPQHFAALQRQQALGNLAQATLVNTVIAPSTGDVDFFTASLTSESGLLPSEELRALWPNVHTVATHTQPAMDLAALLQLGAEQSIGPQWLLLDCLPAAALLRSAQAQLPQVDVVVARVLCAADHAPILCGMGADLKDVADALPGFQLLALQPTRHPAIAYALLVRDYRSATVQALEAHAAESQAKQAAIQAQQTLQAQLQQATQQNAELLKKREQQAQVQQALEADLAKITQAYSAESQAKQAAIQVHQTLQAQLQQVQKDIEIIKNKAKSISSIDKAEKENYEILKREIKNNSYQLMNYLGIESYFSTGVLPTLHSDSRGWPVSPDFSLYLINLLENKKYDLIIEFGSGVSTVVLAKTLNILSKKYSGYGEANICSFEHLVKFYNKTLEMLQLSGVCEYVELHHAALSEWRDLDGVEYQYYSCDKILANLSNVLVERNERILVIVDGPPGKTGPLARYPALDVVLNHFPQSSIDLIMDDYHRDEEVEILNMWKKKLNNLGRKFTVDLIDLEKGACLLSIFK